MNFSPNDHLSKNHCILKNSTKENIQSAKIQFSESKKNLNQLTHSNCQCDFSKIKLLFSQEDLKKKSFIKQFLLPINISEPVLSNANDTLEEQFDKIYRQVKLDTCANFEERMNFDTYKRKTKLLRLEALRLKKCKNVSNSAMKEIVERLQKHEDKCIQKVQASQINISKNKENKINCDQAEEFYKKEKLFVLNRKKRIEKQRHYLHLQEENINDNYYDEISKSLLNSPNKFQASKRMC